METDDKFDYGPPAMWGYTTSGEPCLYSAFEVAVAMALGEELDVSPVPPKAPLPTRVPRKWPKG